MFEFTLILKDSTTGFETIYSLDARTEAEAHAQALAEYPNSTVVHVDSLKLEPGVYYRRFI